MEDSEQEKTADQQTILAIQCLDHQIQVNEERLQSKRKTFSESLKESTQTLNEAIRNTIPSVELCESRLMVIQEADKERQRIEKAKLDSITKIKQEIAEDKAAFSEIIRRTRDPNQTNFNFGSEGDFDPKAGILLSRDHSLRVKRAAENFSEHSQESVKGMEALMSRLDNISDCKIEFPDEVETVTEDESEIESAPPNEVQH